MPNSRLDELRAVDPVLTTIARGYSNAAAISEKLFPIVETKKMKGKIPAFGKDAFVARDAKRALRAASNRIPPAEIELIEYETLERDVEIAIDYLEEEESLDFDRYESRIAKELIDILILGREKEAAELALNPDSYASGNVKQVQTSEKWDDYSSSDSDPIRDVKEGAEAIRSLIGRPPNVLILGASAYRSLVRHPKVADLVKYSGLAKVGVEVLREAFDIPTVAVGMAVYSEDGESFSDIWPDAAVLAYSDASDKNSRSQYNPSFGYALRKSGAPEIDVYFENGGKIKVARATDNYCLKIVAPDAGYLIYDVNANN